MSVGMNSACRVRKEMRTCKHPGCGRKFEGSPTSLYCLDHRTRKSRAERFVPKDTTQAEEANLVVAPAEGKPTMETRVCALPECGRAYSFTIYPDHDVYPMYCELHRTEHKRRFFLKMLSSGRQVKYEEPQYRKWNDYEMEFEDYALKQPQITAFSLKRRRGAQKDWEGDAPPAAA